MDTEELLEVWDGNNRLVAKLQKMVDDNATTQNLSGSVTNAVALGKTIQSSMANYVRLKAASSQMWSIDDVRRLMAALADALGYALSSELNQSELSDSQRSDLRERIVDETTRLFLGKFETHQEQVTEDRRTGITATDRRLLTDERNHD